MKRIILLSIIAVMLISITACGDYKKSNEFVIESVTTDINNTPVEVITIENTLYESDTFKIEIEQPANTHEIIKFGGYDWLVLDKRDDKALILSENVIEHRKFHETWSDITWEDCDLRAYLNNDFYNGFNDEDKTRIIETRVINNGNPWVDYISENNTDDYIFLLNIEEVVKYFGDSGQLINKQPGNDVLKENLGTIKGLSDNERYINDQYNSNRIAYDIDGYTSWWYLRSPAFSIITAVVDNDGYIEIIGNSVNLNTDWGGVRPAVWVVLGF